MLRSPDWKRTRQACGFSGVANPALPKEGGGGPGREGPFSGLPRLLLWGCLWRSNTRAVAGAG